MARAGTTSRSSASSARRGGSSRSGTSPGRYVGVRADASDGFALAPVSEIQRARILSATFDLVGERGDGGGSVAHVVERAGVSRRTFYETFTDLEDCYLAAFERALELAGECVLPAYRDAGEWSERVRAGLLSLLGFLDREPAVGRLLMVESLSGGPKVLERRERVLAKVAEVIDEGRAQKGLSKGDGARAAARAADTDLLPSLTGEGLVGGVLSVIAARLVRVERDSLSGLVNQLMSMIVLPYQGAAAARRELGRPIPVENRPSERPVLAADPFKDMGMRLTYRTVRVLLAVAERPGASNRRVGDSAGISDQGQISKLLGRLQRLELISNTGLGSGMGAPNVWSLTEKGDQFAQSIRVHAQQAGHEQVA